jgi:biopolymer transport protein ExbD
MAMQVGQGDGMGEPEVLIDMNTTPLIDVMLVLLVMLIITIPVQTHAVKLDMPTGAPPPVETVPPEVIRIDIDFDGTTLWNGEVINSRANLEWRIASQILKNPVQPEVHVRPNKLATYKYVAWVMATAQRMGVTKIGIVGSEQFIE